MIDTLDPNQPQEEPQSKNPPTKPTSAMIGNDNLVLISLADLKRFFDKCEREKPELGAGANAVRSFLELFIADIEEDKARQLEEAQAAMEKFNPVKPIGNV